MSKTPWIKNPPKSSTQQQPAQPLQQRAVASGGTFTPPTNINQFVEEHAGLLNPGEVDRFSTDYAYAHSGGLKPESAAATYALEALLLRRG
jgi:hypothetical protein